MVSTVSSGGVALTLTHFTIFHALPDSTTTRPFSLTEARHRKRSVILLAGRGEVVSEYACIDTEIHPVQTLFPALVYVCVCALLWQMMM